MGNRNSALQRDFSSGRAFGVMVRMARFGRLGVLAAMCAMLAMLPASAIAACDAGIGQVQIPSIEVRNNSVAYTGVQPIAYVWSARIEIKCGVFGRVKDWKMLPVLTVAGVGEVSINPAASKSYPFGNRPKSVNRTESRQFEASQVEAFATAACNLHADTLRNNGLSNTEIFSKDRFVALQHWMLANIGYVNTIKVGHIAFFGPGFTEIVCKRFPGPAVDGPDGLAEGPGEAPFSAGLVIAPQTLRGDCSAGLTLSATVKSRNPDKVDIWLESTTGWKSDSGALRSFRFDRAGGYWLAEIEETLDVANLPVLSLGALEHAPDSDLPGILKRLGLLAPEREWSLEQSGDIRSGDVRAGSLRLVAEARGETVASPWVSYSYTCREDAGTGASAG